MTWMLVLGALLLGLVQPAAGQTSTPPGAADIQPLAPELRKRLDEATRLAEQGQLDLAETALTELAQAWPQRPEPLMNLAALATRRQNLALARTHLEAALRTSTAHARAYDQLQQLNAEMARQAYARALAPAAARPGDIVLPWVPSEPDQPSGTAGAGEAPVAAGSSAPASNPVAPDAAGAPNPPESKPVQPAAQPASRPAPPVEATDPAPSGLAASTGWIVVSALALLMATAAGATWAQRQRGNPSDAGTALAQRAADSTASPEARLIDIYRLIGAGRLPEALSAAEALTHDTPRFGLAQMVYGDLLIAQNGGLHEMGQGAMPDDRKASGEIQLLRREAMLRLQGLRDQPPPGAWPRQVLQLAPSVRHLVVVDISRSRLYVLENQPSGPRLLAHHYVAIGSKGAGKHEEGDQRTPLGVYYITSRLDGRQLGEIYGAGALPLSYPNDHDRRLGRTGANIWLHGTPPGRYAQAPRATNGCIALANDDLRRWLDELAPRLTPVVVVSQVDWVHPRALGGERQTALALTESWRRARMQDDVRNLMALYSNHFDNGESGLDAWRERLQREAQATRGRERQLEDVSILGWQERGDVLVVTFTEMLRGSARGVARRQYWSRESGQWKIFSEGVLE